MWPVVGNIFDIKNILGGRRSQPEPPVSAKYIVVRSNISHIEGIFNYTGDIGILKEGDDHVYVFTQDWSGQTIVFPVFEPNTKILVASDSAHYITQADFRDASNDINFIAANETVQILKFRSSVKTLDLRNATNIQSISPSPYGIETLYAKSTTTEQRDICIDIINNSPDGGVLWIKQSETYAAAIIAVATSRGWTIEQL